MLDLLMELGRKNYLFAGNHETAKRSGMLYSLLGTFKMHGIEHYAWLKNVLQQIADHPINKIKELLLHQWAIQISHTNPMQLDEGILWFSNFRKKVFPWYIRYSPGACIQH